MARARWIKPEFYTDARVCRVSDQAALVFPALWVECDDGGVCPGDPRVIYGRRFIMRPTWTVETVENALDELVDAGLVVRFKYRDETFLLIPDFADKQGISGSHVKQWRHLGKAHKEVMASVRTRTNSGGTESHGVGTESASGGARLPPKPLPSPSPLPSQKAVAIAGSVASQPAGAAQEQQPNGQGGVPRETPNPFAVLFPLIREHLWRPDKKCPTEIAGKPWSEDQEGTVIRDLLKSYSLSDLEVVVMGLGNMLRGLAEAERPEWLKIGDKASLRAVFHTRSGVVQMVEHCRRAYWSVENKRPKKPRAEPTAVGELVNGVLP